MVGRKHFSREGGIRHKRAVALHEAGHVTAAAVLGILRNDAIVTIVSAIMGEHGSVSFSKRPIEQWSARYKRKMILTYYAGPAVTKKLHPGVDLFEEGGFYESDMIVAEHLMQSCAPGQWECIRDPVFQSYKERTWRRAVALVDLHWSAVTRLAKELLNCKTITGVGVKAVLATSHSRTICLMPSLRRRVR